jgi:fimbrial chaperone protein
MLHTACRAGVLACVVALCAGFAAPADAGVFTVVPTRVYFGARDRAQAITLTNDGDTAIALQTEIYAWTLRADGTDQLTPTDDLIMAPPLVRIPAKSQQVLRLALLRAIDPQRQLSYRLIVREIPEMAPPAGQGMTVPVALAITLPVFVTPAVANWEVECSAVRGGDRVQVRCGNKGNSFVLVRRAELKRGDVTLGRFEGGAYLLPGSDRPLDIVLPSTPGAGPSALTLTYEQGKQETLDLAIP